MSDINFAWPIPREPQHPTFCTCGGQDVLVMWRPVQASQCFSRSLPTNFLWLLWPISEINVISCKVSMTPRKLWILQWLWILVDATLWICSMPPLYAEHSYVYLQSYGSVNSSLPSCVYGHKGGRGAAVRPKTTILPLYQSGAGWGSRLPCSNSPSALRQP